MFIHVQTIGCELHCVVLVISMLSSLQYPEGYDKEAADRKKQEKRKGKKKRSCDDGRTSICVLFMSKDSILYIWFFIFM